MGIEPTWDLVEPHTGFEDQERHQAALRLRGEIGSLHIKLSLKLLIGFSFRIAGGS